MENQIHKLFDKSRKYQRLMLAASNMYDYTLERYPKHKDKALILKKLCRRYRDLSCLLGRCAMALEKK